MTQTVALSQLDSLRRELIACARDRLEFLVFTKVCKALHRESAALQPLEYLAYKQSASCGSDSLHVAFCVAGCCQGGAHICRG